MLPMIDPVIEAWTSSSRPFWMAKIVMISSVAFPNVAFSSPPTVGPREQRQPDPRDG
jgi:hypothetical protein